MTKTAAKRRTLTADMVGQALRKRILREGLAPGDRLPGYWDLARELDVAYMTVKRGIDVLVADGVVKRSHGKGVFVAERKAPRPDLSGRVQLISANSMHYIMSHAYTSELARGILSAWEPFGSGVIRSMVSEETVLYGDQVEAMGGVALIMMGVENDEYLRMAVNWGRPLVAADYCSEAVPIDFVACDNRAAAWRCVEHLAGLGHRRIVCLAGDGVNAILLNGKREELMVQRSSDMRERRAGVLAAAADLGLPELRVIGGELSLEQAFGFGPNPVAAGVSPADLLGPDGTGGTPAPTARDRTPVAAGVSPADLAASAADRPTALVLGSEMEAPGVIRRLAEMGLRVPEDVSVCAVAGTGMQRDCPNLTLCKFDFYAMGQKAVEVLRAQMARPGKPVNRIHRIGFEFVEGRTCGKLVTGNR